MTETAEPTPPRSRISIGAQTGLFTLIRMGTNMNSRMLYPFLAEFARGLGVDLATISLALTVRAFIGAFSPLVTPLADRFGRKFGMLLGLTLFTLGAGLMVVLPTFAAFLVSVSLTFGGVFIYMSSVQAYLGDTVAYERRGRLISITEMGWSLSFILGMPLIGLLIGRFGWQSPFAFVSILGLLFLLLVYRLIPGKRPQQPAGTGAWANLGAVLHSRSALAGMAMGMFFVSANETVNLVFGVFLENSFGLKLAALGLASAVIGFAELGGEALGAGIVDRFGKKRTMLVGILVNLGAVLALPLLTGSLFGALAGLFFFYLGFEFAFMGGLALMTEVVPGARATMLGAYSAAFSVGRMIGSLAAPALFAFGFQANLLAAIVFNLLGLLALTQVKVGKPL